MSVLCRPLSVVFLVITLAPIGFGQDCAVSVILRVVSKQAQPVVNVTAGQLKAALNGSPATVTSLSPAGNPAIVVVLDASASMRPNWNQSVAAAEELVGKTAGDIEVFVSDERIQDHAVGRTASERLLNQWSAETPRHATAIYDALIQIAGRVKTRNAAIVVISDGNDDASTHSSDATELLFLRSAWPPVFSLIVDYGHPSKRWEDFKKLSISTGGSVAHPSSASAVSAAMEDLAAIALNPLALTLRPSRPISPGAKLKLEILGTRDDRALYPADVVGCDSRSNMTIDQR